MIFKKRKKLIENPDQMVIQYMENYDSKYMKKIKQADPKLLANILSQYDLRSISTFLMKAPKQTALHIYQQFDQERQKDILKRLPSDFAALFVAEQINQQG